LEEFQDGKKLSLAKVLHTDHQIWVDEIQSHGGSDMHQTPKDLEMTELGASSSQAIRKHATDKNWKLESVRVKVSHERKSSESTSGSHSKSGKVDLYTQEVELFGQLTKEQKRELFKAADTSYMHTSLTTENVIQSKFIEEPEHKPHKHESRSSNVRNDDSYRVGRKH